MSKAHHQPLFARFAALFTAVLWMSTLWAPAASASDGTICQVGCVTTYSVPVAAGEDGPFAITKGPLGSEWFSFGDTLARIDDSGIVTRYPVPTVGAHLRWITVGDHQRVWFGEISKVGWLEVSTSGTRLREYALPHQSAGAIALVAGPDGNIYVSEQLVGKIARIEPRSGRVREFDVPSGDPLGLTVGPDGALWFVEREPGKVARMTLDGHVREWPLAAGAFPNRITVGADGALWFTELGTNSIGRITTSGHLTEYPTSGGPVGITAGRDGKLYVTLFTDGALAQVNLRGKTTARWVLPDAGFALQNGLGRGGDIWATDLRGHVYRVTPYSRAN